MWQTAKKKGLRQLGIETGKALSIIYSEYEKDFEVAIETISLATTDFGDSAILEEQRANCYLQIKEPEKALSTWKALIGRFGNNAVIDTFAYRRMGLAAASINRWEDAANAFEWGANTLPANTPLSPPRYTQLSLPTSPSLVAS